MPAPLRVGDCVIVRGADKCCIECLNEDNYVTVLFIIGRNKEIVPHNNFCQVTIVEGTGSQSGNMCNIFSAPNKLALIRISGQSTQAEEEESLKGEGR